MSLRIKLILLFLAIALIPLFFVSALTFHNYKNSLETTRLTQMQDLAAFKTDKIEAYFSGLKVHIETAQSFYNIKKNLPVLIRLAGDPTHVEFVAAKKILDDQLQQMQSVLGIVDIMLVNPEGKAVYSSNPRHYPKDFSNPLADPEQKAFEEGKNSIYLSDIFLNQRDDNKPQMLITAPAADFNGNFIGVIVFEVDTTYVYKVIQDTTGLGKTGEILIGKKIGNQVLFLNPLRHDPNAALVRTRNIGDKTGIGMQNAVQGTGIGRYIDYRGVEVVGAWRYIPSLDWGMVAKIDADEAFAEAIKLKNLAIIILIIVIVLSGITAFSIAQSIAEPIKKLSEGAAIIGSGNLDYKIGTHLKDEIGQLSRSFDTMTGDLKQTLASRDELNREIAERKKTEDTLRRNEATLRGILDATQESIWLFSEDGFVLTANQTALVRFGKSAQEVVGKHMNDILPAPLAQLRMAKLEEAVKSALPVDFEDRRGDIFSHHSFYPVKDTNGRVISVVSFSRDITERKRAETALRESEMRFRLALRNAPVSVAAQDRQLRYIWAYTVPE